jgi:hypothetical protein
VPSAKAGILVTDDNLICGLGPGREHAPSIIFMDEVDSIGSARTDSGSSGGDSEVQRTMLELLNQLDGFEATNKIKVAASPPARTRICAVAHIVTFSWPAFTGAKRAASACLSNSIPMHEISFL